MSLNIALKSHETIPFTTLLSMHPPHSPVHLSISVSLSAFLSFLVHKCFAQMTKTYVLLPDSGMKVNIKQLLIFSSIFCTFKGLYFIPVANFN